MTITALTNQPSPNTLLVLLHDHSIPQVLLEGFGQPQGDGIGTQLYITSCNTVFLFVAVSVAYGLVSSMGGTRGNPCALGGGGELMASCRQGTGGLRGWEGVYQKAAR